MLVVVAAFAVLVATIWLPVLQIYGSSMEPTLNEGNIVVSVKGSHFQQGDLVAFYIGNKILVKRVIAGPGQVVDIDEAGNVSGRAVPDRKIVGWGQYRPAVSGAGQPVFLYGRSPLHFGGFPPF